MLRIHRKGNNELGVEINEEFCQVKRDEGAFSSGTPECAHSTMLYNHVSFKCYVVLQIPAYSNPKITFCFVSTQNYAQSIAHFLSSLNQHFIPPLKAVEKFTKDCSFSTLPFSPQLF